MGSFLLTTATALLNGLAANSSTFLHVNEPLSSFHFETSVQRIPGFTLLGNHRSGSAPGIYYEVGGGIAALHAGRIWSDAADEDVFASYRLQEDADWGSKLSGEFALAVMDLSRKELILRTDKSGAIPLHWGTVGRDDFAASTSREALLRLGAENIAKLGPGGGVRFSFGTWVPVAQAKAIEDRPQPGGDTSLWHSWEESVKSLLPILERSSGARGKFAVHRDGSIGTCALECALKQLDIPYVPYQVDMEAEGEISDRPPSSDVEGVVRVAVGFEGLEVEHAIYKMRCEGSGAFLELAGPSTLALGAMRAAWQARLDGLEVGLAVCSEHLNCAQIWQLWSASGMEVIFPLHSFGAKGPAQDEALFSQYISSRGCKCHAVPILSNAKMPLASTEDLESDIDAAAYNSLREEFLQLLLAGNLLAALSNIRQFLDEYPHSLQAYKLLHEVSMPGVPSFMVAEAASATDREALLSALTAWGLHEDKRWAEICSYLRANVLVMWQRRSEAEGVLLHLYSNSSKSVEWGKEGHLLHADDRVQVVTVASEWREALDHLQRSADLAGVELHVLGLGEPYHANGQKTLLYLEHIATLPPGKLVLAVDAYDILLSPIVAELPTLFEQARMGARVVFAAEEGIYPDLAAEGLHPPAPDGHLERFLNSGTFVGRAGDLVVMLQEMAGYDSMPTTCDQRASTRFFLSHPKEVTLDYGQIMFKPLFNCPWPIISHPDGTLSVHGHKPALLHFNARYAKDMFPHVVAAWDEAQNSGMDQLVKPHPFAAGLGFYQRGEFENSIQSFARAIKDDPENIEAHFNLAYVHHERGDQAMARLAYIRALSITPEHQGALHGLARLALEGQNFKEALDFLQRAYEARPSDDRMQEILRVRQLAASAAA